MNWRTVIGLEVHIQLATQSKIFSGSATTYGASPNSQASAIDLGMPGVLPVLNKAAVEMAIKFGLAIDAHINPRSIFARKNYFYPDLPKGYQISQFELPIVGEGALTVQVNEQTQKTIGIERAHLEEDAGKSIHDAFDHSTGIDLNRAGTPLLEIVSKPDMNSAAEAIAYLKTLHALVRYLDICDGNMQEGSFRCDVNISIMPEGSTTLGTRTELKNLNSFKFIEQAIYTEVERHIDILESGGTIIQETRLFDPIKNETRAMRSKENAHDYRYFPDPDLLPVLVSDTMLADIKSTLPELPQAKKQRFQTEFGLNNYDASLLVSDKAIALYFEKVVALSGHAKTAANWINGTLMAYLNKTDCPIENALVAPEHLAKLIERITDNTLSNAMAKQVFEILTTGTETDVDSIIDKHNLKQMNNADELSQIVNTILDKNPDQVAQYRAGKTKVFGFFVGQVMKITRGQANPQQVNELLKAHLEN